MKYNTRKLDEGDTYVDSKVRRTQRRADRRVNKQSLRREFGMSY